MGEIALVPTTLTPPAEFDSSDFSEEIKSSDSTITAEKVDGSSEELDTTDDTGDTTEETTPEVKSTDKQTVQKSPVSKVPEVKTETKQEPEVKQEENPDQPKPRDYSKYKAEDQLWLRGIKNSRFLEATKQLDKYYQIEKELEDTKKQLNDLPKSNILDHPEGYRLSSDYTELAQKSNFAEFEQQFYQEQLVNIESGKPFYTIEGYNEQGQPVYSRAIKITKDNQIENKVAVGSALNQAIMAGREFQGKLSSFKDGYNKDYKSSLDLINAAAEKAFKKDLPENFRPKDEEVNQFISQIPAIFKSGPMTKIAASLYSITMRQASELSKLRGMINTTSANQNDQRRAGPKTEEVIKSGKSSPKDIDFAEIESEFR